MKNIFILPLLIACAVRSSAQGTLQITSGANIKTLNNASIVLDNMHMVNNGNVTQVLGNGTTSFAGSLNVNISGTGTTNLDKLDIAKTSPAKVTLQQNVGVAGQVNFTSGLLDLNNSVLNLGTSGMVNGETEANRITASGTGYVQVINVLNAPASANPGNLGAILTSTKNLGTVTIKRGHLAQPNVSGSTPGIRRYYDILPANDNALKATLRFQYFDAELNGLNENTLELWTQAKKNWTRVGYTSRNATTNFVEETGINTLSRWTLSGTMNTVPVNTVVKGAMNENSEIKNHLLVWPNPVTQLANVIIHTSQSSLIKLRLYTATGALILIREGKLSAGKNIFTVDMSNMPSGTYNLIIQFSGLTQIKQIIKQ
jgi:type IX secretion system substrate protein